MVFWISVGVVLALVLLLAWRYDRRRRGSGRHVTGPEQDPHQAEALGQSHVHGSHQPGGAFGGISGP